MHEVCAGTSWSRKKKGMDHSTGKCQRDVSTLVSATPDNTKINVYDAADGGSSTSGCLISWPNSRCPASPSR